MKIIRKSAIVVSTLLITLAQILNFTACAEQVPTAKNSPSQLRLNIVNFRDGTASLKKIVPVSQLVTQQDGGELILNYKTNEGDDVALKISLKVFPGSISQDAELTLSLDDEKLDLTFSPHGITFSEPALLNIEAKNLDLSAVPSQLNVYYDNPDTGQWEMMDSYDVVLSQDRGYLKIIDTKIPHFSRYSVGWGE